MDRFKLAIVLGYFGLVLAAIVGGMFIIVTRPESFPVASAFLGTMLTGATGAVVTFYMLGNQAKKIEEVKTLSNGTLTALREENAQLHAQLLSVVAAAPSAEQEPTSS